MSNELRELLEFVVKELDAGRFNPGTERAVELRALLAADEFAARTAPLDPVAGREVFEAWACSVEHKPYGWLGAQYFQRMGDSYEDDYAHGLWTGWQASSALAAQQPDAERYRWLRAQHWNSGPLAVVSNPAANVRLGVDCPSTDRLDAIIDTYRAAQATGAGSQSPFASPSDSKED